MSIWYFHQIRFIASSMLRVHAVSQGFFMDIKLHNSIPSQAAPLHDHSFTSFVHKLSIPISISSFISTLLPRLAAIKLKSSHKEWITSCVIKTRYSKLVGSKILFLSHPSIIKNEKQTIRNVCWQFQAIIGTEWDFFEKCINKQQKKMQK